LVHVNASLEGKLPGMIGGVTLCTLSMPLSTFIASTKGGDSVLYTPWLAKFGKTPDQIDLAATVDLTQTLNFHEQAIEVPASMPRPSPEGSPQLLAARSGRSRRSR